MYANAPFIYCMTSTLPSQQLHSLSNLLSQTLHWLLIVARYIRKSNRKAYGIMPINWLTDHIKMSVFLTYLLLNRGNRYLLFYVLYISVRINYFIYSCRYTFCLAVSRKWSYIGCWPPRDQMFFKETIQTVARKNCISRSQLIPIQLQCLHQHLRLQIIWCNDCSEPMYSLLHYIHHIFIIFR